MKKLSTYDKGDYILQTSLYSAGLFMWFGLHCTAIRYMGQLISDCRLNTIHAIKSPGYRWSGSGSENPKENTLFKRPTKWIYDNISRIFVVYLVLHVFMIVNICHFSTNIYLFLPAHLSPLFFLSLILYIKQDPHKGANADQLRAFFIVMYLNREAPIYKKIWLKMALGFILRAGLTPSLCEWAPLKPQAYVLFLMSAPYGLKYPLYPLILISKWAFKRSYYNEMINVSISQDTTNKISAIPTGEILGLKETPTDNYVADVYKTYFTGKGAFIGLSIRDGVKNYK